MRGIILKDLYEGFCIKKNLINWLASMIFTSALTAISEFMRGAYGFADCSTPISCDGKYTASDDGGTG